MIEFQIITDNDLLKATLMNRARLAVSGCWEWVGSRDGKGYGMFCVDNKTRRAHRVSYEIFVGKIPTGHVIRHSCDNPGCINPNHLSTGTQKDNVADREARGRRDVRGEQIGTAKLTENQVREIRSMPDVSLDVLAEKYGVDRSNIWAIRNGKSWRHVAAHAAN